MGFCHSGLIDISSFHHVSALLLHHTREIALLIFKYGLYYTSLLLGKSIMNKHAGKHIRCIIKSRKVFFIAGKQLESGDPH